LVGERIRAAFTKLKRTDVEFQAASLVELHDILKALTGQLNEVVDRRG